MGILNKERFVDILVAAEPAKVDKWGYVRGGSPIRGQLNLIVRRPDIHQVQFDRESALEMYDQIKAYISRVGYLPGKYLRPWDLDPQLYAGLDRTKAWWGFEFETGYRTREARSQVVEHVWETWDNVVFDSEGEGNAGVEITFGPQEMDKFDDGTAQAYQFVEYLDSIPELVDNRGAEGVGLHINMSIPEMDRNNINYIAYSLARSVAALPVDMNGENVRMKLFGRTRIYGGFFPQVGNDGVWIEGKSFRTTYKVEQFKQYLKTCAALTAIAKLVALDSMKPRQMKVGQEKMYPHVTNLYEMVTDGAVPVVVWEKYIRDGIDGMRGNNYLNGPLSRDTYKTEVEPHKADLFVGNEDAPYYDDNDEPEDYDDADEDEDQYEGEYEDDLDGPERGEIEGYHWCDGCEVYHRD